MNLKSIPGEFRGPVLEMHSVAIPFQQLEGKYEILEKMSEGGMGAVYKVRHRLLDEIRVIKVMRPHLAEDVVLRKRFVREAKTAIRLRHANLAQVYDFTMDESGYFFLAMEFIDGIDLHGLAKSSGSVPIGLALEISYQSLDVIGYLHRKEIVHRDISPDNLLIGRDDEGNFQVKLIDLGIAKVQESNENLTATGTFLGKVKYSSPEQFQSKDGNEVGPRSDLYSFGVVLYELLTGSYPIKGKSISSLISGHLIHPALPFETSDPEGRIPEALRALALKALEKDPSDRFQTASEFRKQIGQLRRDFPTEKSHLDRLFEAQRAPTTKIRVDRPGSTQGRLNRNFGVETTPSNGILNRRDAKMDLVPGPRRPGSGTEVLPEEGSSGGRRSTVDRQIRALLLGAEKLIEAQHFDEARLQIEAADNIEPGRTDVEKLAAVLDRADTAMQRRREHAATEIEALIRAERFDSAREGVGRRTEELGNHSLFEDLSEAIAQAENAAAERVARAQQILVSARRLMKDDQWEDAVPMIREALVLTPDDADARTLLNQAEGGLTAWLETRRLQAEIERTAAVIEASILEEDIESVRRSLKLAEKLYGDHPRFSDFPKQLKNLEALDRSRKVEALQDQAAAFFAAEDFIAATLKLEEALDLEPKNKKLKVALDQAVECQQLKEEQARRAKIIGETTDGLRRLADACRFQAAFTLLDEAVVSLQSFDEEAPLRKTVTDAANKHKKLARRIDKAVAEVEAAIKSSDFERAHAALEVSRELVDDCPEALGAVETIAAELISAEGNFRREKDIQMAAKSVEKRLENGQLDPAERELLLARRLFGRERVFDTLAVRLADAQRENERKDYTDKINNAVDSSVPFPAVLALIESALAFDPKDKDFQRFLIETRRAEREEAQARRRPAIDETLAEIDGLITRGQIAEALSALQSAVEEIGPFKEARALQYRLKKV